MSQIRRVVQFLQSIEADKSSELNKMEKNECRAVIKNFYIKSSTSKEIKAELDQIRGSSVLSFQKVHDMILNDQRVIVREIVEAIVIPHGTVITILYVKSSMKKLSARWVPRLLTVENERNRATDSMTALTLFRRNLSEFLHHYITVDVTWIHFYTTETKE